MQRVDRTPGPQSFDRVLSSMCTEPHPAARRAAERFLATNPGDPASYPAVADLEAKAIDYLGEVAGLDDPEGYIASGGTEANIQAVRAARNLAREGNGVGGVNVVASESAHFSFHKAAGLLDVELRLVPTRNGKADLAAVEAAVDEETALVVGIAGTTEYGRVDPIPELAGIARSAGARVHVDAAWGGFLLPFTDHAWDFSDADIDSMTIDPHKVGRAAIPAGGLLVRDRETLDALAVETPYLESASQASLTGTRSGAGVASTVAACEALWPDGYRETYERARANAEWLAGELSDRGFPIVDPELPIVAAEIPFELFESLREAGWRISRTGRGELRVVCMPHVTRTILERFLADVEGYR
ncbi:MAG: tyrosine decarboxylase MfnA [Halalkalicoccus sp.]|nr:tyrosine decarboxylase MfnA [Halalkalicoccus sp.]